MVAMKYLVHLCSVCADAFTMNTSGLCDECEKVHCNVVKMDKRG